MLEEYGSFIKSCMNEGIDAYGIEPSKNLADKISKSVELLMVTLMSLSNKA